MVKCKAVICGVTGMNDAEQARFRDMILARLQELEQDDALGEAGKATVELDQQAIGRLSRMDALQNQAMARATGARRDLERRRLLIALEKLDGGEFGYCEDCGDAIAIGRLELDPAAPKCVDCAIG